MIKACPIEEQLTQLDHLVEMDRVHWHSLQPELLARVRRARECTSEDPSDAIHYTNSLPSVVAALLLQQMVMSRSIDEHLRGKS